MSLMKRAALALLLIAAAAPAGAAEAWTGAGWYQVEVFPDPKIDSARFDSEAQCVEALPPKKGDAIVDCGYIAKAGGEVDHAIDFFSGLIKNQPKNAALINQRGNLYTQKHDFAHAIADYTAAMKAKPEDYWAYVLRASAYQTKGERDKAIADYRAAIAHNPDPETLKDVKTQLKKLGVDS
jgi:tetratricopeptide (TPR) repeat protein